MRNLEEIKQSIDESLPEHLERGNLLDVLQIIGEDIAQLGGDLGYAVEYLMKQIREAFIGQDGYIDLVDISDINSIYQLYNAFERVVPLISMLNSIEITDGISLESAIQLQYKRFITFGDELLQQALGGFIGAYGHSRNPNAVDGAINVISSHTNEVSLPKTARHRYFPNVQIDSMDDLVLFLYLQNPFKYCEQVVSQIQQNEKTSELIPFLNAVSQGLKTFLGGERGLFKRANLVLENHTCQEYRNLLEDFEGVRKVLVAVREAETNIILDSQDEEYVPVSHRIGKDIKDSLLFGEYYLRVFVPLFIDLATHYEYIPNENYFNARRMLSFGLMQMINPYIRNPHVVVAKFLGIALNNNLTSNSFQGHHGAWIQTYDGLVRQFWTSTLQFKTLAGFDNTRTRKVPTKTYKFGIRSEFLQYCKYNLGRIAEEHHIPETLLDPIVMNTHRLLDAVYERHQRNSKV